MPEELPTPKKSLKQLEKENKSRYRFNDKNELSKWFIKNKIVMEIKYEKINKIKMPKL